MNDIQASAERLDIGVLRSRLTTHLFAVGERLIYRHTVESTNTVAMQLAQQYTTEEGVVILTDYQTAGRGRQGRRWVDSAGCNAISSTVLRPLFPPYLLVMIAALAVMDTISEVCALDASIKWPNDVMIGDKKVAGILIETSYDQARRMIAIMGIGINVNTPVLSETAADVALPSMLAKATTLESACGQRVSREVLLAVLLGNIEASYLHMEQEASDRYSYSVEAAKALRERWRNHLSTLGRAVQVRQGDTFVEGFAEDVDEHGELLLRRHSGERISISWGDIGYPMEEPMRD